MKQTWKTEYSDSKITVINRWFGPTELYINDKLVDKQSGILSVKLFGQINSTKEVKVLVNAGFVSVECDIFVDNELIFSSK